MLTDEKLVEAINNGDEIAENELFSRYKDLVTKIARGYFMVDGDLEDLTQEGMIGLYKAIKGFSKNKETSFKTFAVVCIKHQIQTAIKKSNTNKNKPLSSAISFQSFTNNSNNENIEFLPMELILEDSPAEKIINKENYENLKYNIKKTLSAMEYNVLKLYLQGYSYNEISTILKISNKSIDNSLSRIKKKLREKITEHK